jgi:hypothetical protein
MTRKMYATTHVCTLHISVAYINQVTESQPVRFEKHLCMQLAEVSKLHESTYCIARTCINAMYAPLKGCAPLHTLHTSPVAL